MDATHIYDAFISYRRSDGETIARTLRARCLNFKLPPVITAAIGEHKLSVYIDTIYERADEDFFEQTIKPALRNSHRLVVIQTPAALDSQTNDQKTWVAREIEYFLTLPQGNNISIALARGSFTDALPGGLAERFENIDRVDIRKLGRIWSLIGSNPVVPLIATLYGVPANLMPELHREESRKRVVRVAAFLLAATTTILLLTSSLVLTLLSRSKARAQEQVAIRELDRAERQYADSLAQFAEGARKSGDDLSSTAFLTEARNHAVTPRVVADVLSQGLPKVIFSSTLLRTDLGARPVAFRPTTSSLAVGMFDGAVRIYQLPEHSLQRELLGADGPVTGIAFSGDGEKLIVASRTPAHEFDIGRSGSIRIYQAAEPYTQLQSLKGPPGDAGFLSVAADRTASIVVAGRRDGLVYWNRARGTIGRLISTKGIVTSVAVSDDSKYVAAGSEDGFVWIWGTTPSFKLCRVEKLPVPEGPHPRNSLGVSFANTKHIVASGSYDGTVWLWDVESKIPGVRLLGHTDAVQTVVFSDDGALLASGAWDGTARIWDVEKRVSIARLRSNGMGIEAIAFSPDIRWVVTTETTGFTNSADPPGKSSYGATRVWRMTTNRRHGELRKAPGDVMGFGFTDTGDLAIWYVDEQRALHVQVEGSDLYVPELRGYPWNPDSQSARNGTKVSFLGADRLGYQSGSEIWQPLTSLRNEHTLLVGSALSSDGTLLAIATAQVGDDHLSSAEIKLLRLGDGLIVQKQAVERELLAMGPLRFSPDDTSIAVGVSRLVRFVNGTRPESAPEVFIWKIRTGGIQKLSGSKEDVCSLAFSPAGTQLAAGTVYGNVVIWNLPSGTQRELSMDFTASPALVAYASGGRSVLAASLNQIKVWNVENWLGRTFFLPWSFEVTSLDVSPTGTAALGGANGELQFWDIDSDSYITSTFVGRAVVIEESISTDNNRMAILTPEGVRVLGSAVPLQTIKSQRITRMRVVNSILKPLSEEEESKLGYLSEDLGEPAKDTAAAQFWKSWRECQVKEFASRATLSWPSWLGGTRNVCMARWLLNNPDHYLASQLKRTVQSGQ